MNAPMGAYRAIALRSYDSKTGEWAIWWLDGRYPAGPMDPPVQGHFETGVGTFYSDYMDHGKPMRVRFIWSHITPSSARWEQALSSDAGKTWKTNWVMEFRRRADALEQIERSHERSRLAPNEAAISMNFRRGILGMEYCHARSNAAPGPCSAGILPRTASSDGVLREFLKTTTRVSLCQRLSAPTTGSTLLAKCGGCW